MKYNIIGKNVVITEAIKAKVIEKLSLMEKYLKNHQEVECRVLVRVYPNKQKVEVTIPTKVVILRAEVEAADVYSAIDIVVDKLERQLEKSKSRLNRKNSREKLGKAIAMEFIKEDVAKQEKDILVKTKTLEVDPLELDEAAARMEMLDHNFFIYKDLETGRISVLYRRNDGNLGLIEVISK